MGSNTKIEWAANADGSEGATWNPIRAGGIMDDKGREKIGWHCEHVSEGCRNCYAESWNARFGTGRRYAPQELEANGGAVKIFLDERMATAPLRARKPTTYFLSSMTDLFADFVPDDMIDKLFAVMAMTPQHTFIIVTKRAQRMHDYINDGDARGRGLNRATQLLRSGFEVDPAPAWPLPNVWQLVSVEDQASADERIPLLLATPAAVRGISAEPLLGDVRLTHVEARQDHLINVLDGSWMQRAHGPMGMTSRDKPVTGRVDWVIVGGESGSNARPMHPDWARSLRDQCAAADVPFFFKQWGEWQPDAVLDEVRKRGVIMRSDGTMPTDADMGKMMSGDFDIFTGWQHFSAIGKKRAGRLLDGIEHNTRPKL